MIPVHHGQFLLAASLAASLLASSAVAQSPTSHSESAIVRQVTTITRIDKDQRIVTVALPDGKSRPVKLGPEVRNFDRIAIGDTVELSVFVTGILDLKRPTGDTPHFQVEDASATAPPGAKPAGFYAEKISAVVSITSIDAEAGAVTFVGPLGNVFSVKSADEAFKKTMRDFRVGELALASYVEALSIVVVPKR